MHSQAHRTDLVPIANLPALYNPKDLALIRRTVAADTSDDEFSLFINKARHLGLDPLRRQVYAFVFSKDKPDKRRMSIIVAIDGLRTIAARAGDYRPDENEPEFEYDDAQKGSTNPLGLVKVTVRVWKFSHGDWHKITGTAYWDEAAPIRDEWAFSAETGRRAPTGHKELDQSGNWPKMPRLMLAKVAEAAALRKGWPDDLSSVFEGAEIDRARAVDLLPSEAADQGAIMERLERIGGKDALIIDWLNDSPLDPVPIGQLADRIIGFIRDRRRDHHAINAWRDRNRHALREFWARAPADALGVKQAIEQALTHDSSELK